MTAEPVPRDEQRAPIENDSRGRWRSMGSRVFWSFADQAISSLTNAGLSIVVARTVDQSSFGTFSLVLVTYSFAVGVGRAVICDIFVIRFSDVTEQVRWKAARAATGGALMLGLLSSVVICLVGGVLASQGQTRSVWIALGVALPGLLLQDCSGSCSSPRVGPRQRRSTIWSGL